MRTRIIIFLLVSSFTSINVVDAQVTAVKFNAIDNLLRNKSDTTLVINFWATWCKPCIQELPYFEELNARYSSSKVRVVLVSMDFKRELESRVKSFISKNNIRSEVLLLDEPDYNSWIDQVDSTWSGAIPATAFVTEGKKLFLEKEFSSYSELEQIVQTLIQK